MVVQQSGFFFHLIDGHTHQPLGYVSSAAANRVTMDFDRRDSARFWVDRQSQVRLSEIVSKFRDQGAFIIFSFAAGNFIIRSGQSAKGFWRGTGDLDGSQPAAQLARQAAWKP